MNRHNAKPTIITAHYLRAMSRAKYMARKPNPQTVRTWAAHMRAHFEETDKRQSAALRTV
jgi:hypothetical protein